MSWLRWVLSCLIMLFGGVAAGCSAALPPLVSSQFGAMSPTPESAMRADPEAGLFARHSTEPIVVDGLIEPAWASANAISIPLTWGMRGTEHALDVEMRMLYTDESLYLLAQWPDAPAAGRAGDTTNKLTVHWRIPVPAGLPEPACDVACHTFSVNGDGRLAYANAETIPPGGGEQLEAAGSWQDGLWTFEWQRPLQADNQYDLQFDELDGNYLFFLKIFRHLEGEPDALSQRYSLWFEEP